MKQIIVFIILLCMVSCFDIERHYRVDSLDLTISISRLGSDRYRVWLNNKQNNLRCNYIDLKCQLSDLPSISLLFPISKLHTIDTVYVKDDYNEVKQYESKDFVFVLSTRDYSSTKDYGRWTDSTMFKVPCVEVQLNAYLDGITVFDQPTIGTEE